MNIKIPDIFFFPIKSYAKNITINSTAALLTAAITVKVWESTQKAIAYFHQKNQKIFCSFTAAIGITVCFYLLNLSYQILLHAYYNRDYSELWNVCVRTSCFSNYELMEKTKDFENYLQSKKEE